MPKVIVELSWKKIFFTNCGMAFADNKSWENMKMSARLLPVRIITLEVAP